MNFDEFSEKINLPLAVYNNLELYVDLLKKWQKSINLISKNTIDDIWDRHIIDSVQLVKCIPQSVKSICDLGSGGGFPGLVIAISCPQIHITLVDSDKRKCAFLKEVTRKLSLKNVKVLSERIQDINDNYDLITSRALAKLSLLIELSANLIHDDSLALFLKGNGYKDEIKELESENPLMDLPLIIEEIIPSITHKESVIIRMSAIGSLDKIQKAMAD